MAQFAIEQVPLFKNLSRSELSLLTKFLLPKQYKLGDKVFKRDGIRDKVVIVKEGAASIKNDINPEQTIALFKMGDSLGELALVQKNSTHKYNTQAASDKLETLELSVYNWHTIIKTNPKLKDKLFNNISEIIHDKLTHANNKLVTLFTTGKIIGSYDNLENIAERIIDVVLKIIPSRQACFGVLKTDAHKLYVAYSEGYKNFPARSYYDVNDDPLLSELVKKPRTSFINYGELPPSYARLPYINESVIIVPVLALADVIGFIILTNKINGNNFSINNQLLLETIGHQAAPAIKQILATEFESAKKDIKQDYVDPFGGL